MTEAKPSLMDRISFNPLPLFLILLSAAGLAITYVDANLSYIFGETVDKLVAWGLWALAIGSGILPVITVMFWRQGHKEFAKVLGAASVGLFLVNVSSNMPIATANRVVEAESAGLQKAKFEDLEASKADAKAQIRLFYERKQKLLGDLDDLVKKDVAGWKVSVTPTTVASVDGMIAEKKDERTREASRGCGRPPCKGPKYETRSRELQHLLAVRAMAVDIEKIESQIAAAERVVSAALEKLSDSGSEEAGINHTAAASEFVERWTFGWWQTKGDKSAKVRTSNEALGMIMAFGLALGGIALNLAGAYPYLMKITPDSPNTGARSNQPREHHNPISETPAPTPIRVPALAMTARTVGDLNIAKLRELVNANNIQVAA